MRSVLITATTAALALSGCAAQSPVATGATASGSPAPSASVATSATASAAVTRPTDLTIPWLDVPGAHLELSPLPTTTPTDTAPPCRAEQLTVASVEGPGDTADDGAIVVLRNTSQAACRLTGPVHATLYGPNTPPVTIVGSSPPFHSPSHDMAPGGATSVWFTANGVCMTGPAHGLEAIPVTGARLQIPGGGSVLVRGLRMPRTCGGPYVGAFYQHPVDPVYPPEPLQGATVTVLAPSAVQALSTLHYVVEITNPGSMAITMQPCPSFHQALSTYPDKSFHRLNCAGHTALLPYETLRFAMQLEVPQQEPNGPERLLWSLDTAGGADRPTVVDVVGSVAGAPPPPPPSPGG